MLSKREPVTPLDATGPNIETRHGRGCAAFVAANSKEHGHALRRGKSHDGGLIVGCFSGWCVQSFESAILCVHKEPQLPVPTRWEHKIVPAITVQVAPTDSR